MNGLSKASVEVKGIKKGIIIFVCHYMDGRACVCVSVLWKQLNNFAGMKGS
jgi:hypothetical protein